MSRTREGAGFFLLLGGEVEEEQETTQGRERIWHEQVDLIARDGFFMSCESLFDVAKERR